MNALAVCKCSHAVVLHKGFSPVKNTAFRCLACACHKFNFDREHIINTLIVKLEEEK